MTPPPVRPIVPRVGLSNIVAAGISVAFVAPICGVAVAAGAPIVSATVGMFRRWFHQRTAVKDAVKQDLKMLNSPSVLHGPGRTMHPPSVCAEEVKGVVSSKLVDEKTNLERNNQRLFICTWARLAKGRFSFARECADTPVNRAALHRWFRSEWKKLEFDELKMDYYMDECIEMALEGTLERVQVMAKRKMRRQARTEYYLERLYNMGRGWLPGFK
jgi:hypothetical protein